jgi:hypothetical protein
MNLQARTLKYFWTVCVELDGSHALMHQKYVFNEWKPLRWFVNGDKPNIIEP